MSFLVTTTQVEKCICHPPWSLPHAPSNHSLSLCHPDLDSSWIFARLYNFITQMCAPEHYHLVVFVFFSFKYLLTCMSSCHFSFPFLCYGLFVEAIQCFDWYRFCNLDYASFIIFPSYSVFPANWQSDLKAWSNLDFVLFFGQEHFLVIDVLYSLS